MTTNYLQMMIDSLNKKKGNTAKENETAAESTAAQIPGRTKRTGIGPGYED